jgi:hypothetical protein
MNKTQIGSQSLKETILQESRGEQRKKMKEVKKGMKCPPTIVRIEKKKRCQSHWKSKSTD